MENIMKTLITLGLAGFFLFALAIDTTAVAQDKTKTTLNGPRNQGKIRPNFVDANNDGICDHQADGTQVREHKQLRDGSCGVTPAPGTNNGTGTGNATGTGNGKGFRGGRK